MRKSFKRALLSTLATVTVAFASTATVLMTANASSVAEPVSATKFEMVDGAAIRLATPNGLRFIAEMDAATYDKLTANEAGVSKKMGMFIVPYSYLSDASRYSNGEEGVNNNDYEKITKKIDLEFYNSDKSVNKIYQDGDSYRANGVIANLKLPNYDREFVGIAYIATTSSGQTTYTYAEFDHEDDVRSAAYVAIEAYDDYKDIETAKLIMENYVYGAHLETIYEGAIIERVLQDRVVYEFEGVEYESLKDFAGDWANIGFSVSLNQKQSLFLGNAVTLNTTIYNGDVVEGEPITFNDAHAIWSSSNENIIKVDKNGVATAVGAGEATITASFMGESASCSVKALETFDGTFETATSVYSHLTKASQTESLEIVDLGGNKVLKMNGTSGKTGHGLNVTLDFLSAYFADPNVQYLAFDVKSETTNTTNFRRSTIRTTGTVGSWGQEPYEADIIADNTNINGIKSDAFKTFYFTRTDYNNWVNNSKSVEMLISAAGFAAGESIYVDNIRPATQAEYLEACYDFETGGIRPNGGNLLIYMANTGSTWQYAITADSVNGSKPTFSSYGFTNDAPHGNRALIFTKTAGQVTMRFNSTSVQSYKDVVQTTGYYAVDLYVPADSDATFTYRYLTNSSIPGNTPNKGAWTTFYLKPTDHVFLQISDTTGGTYMLDNLRSISAEEYENAKYSFEAGAGGLRTNLMNDENTNQGAFYFYGWQKDYSGVAGTIIVAEGNGANDVNAVSNVRYATDIVKDGNYSLAFDKGKGYLYMTWHANSESWSHLGGGLSFWMYSTTAIDGVNTTSIVAGDNGKLNGGAGINVPANQWTKIVVTQEDLSGARFLILQGNWTGTIYLDNFQPLNANTVTFNAGIGTLASSNQVVVKGEAYQLPTPTAYRDFLGWYDESDNLVDMSGVWNYDGNVTLTARYSDVVSFENIDGAVPSYMTAADTTESLSIVEMNTTDGNKALRIKSNTNTSATYAERAPALKVTLDFIASFFEDSSVDYIAFDAKSGSTKTSNFRRVTLRSNGTFAADCYEEDFNNGKNGADYVAYNGISADAFKTFYFSRADYQAWVNQGVASERFIASGNWEQGDSIYIDNIRKATAEEYNAAAYALEGGNVRIDGKNRLFYMPQNNGGQWQWGILPSVELTWSGYTNEYVSDGIRAYAFTPAKNSTTTIRFNTNATTNMQKGLLDKTGYFAFDLYVSNGANATFAFGSVNNAVIPSASPVEGDWTTIYVKSSTTFVQITDTTGATYAIDNFRSITAEEFDAAALGFEAGAGGLRTNLLAEQNAFYYYGLNHGGSDYTGVKYSVVFNGGSGATLSNPRYDSTNVHDGKYSLAFEKTNGGMALQLNTQSTATYSVFQTGLSFWMYSTVAINGTTASNIIDGAGNKLGTDDAGILVRANEWTKITIEPNGIVNGKFLTIQGSTGGTYYFDCFEAEEFEIPEALEYNTTVESENQDGTRHGILLGASTHTLGLDVLPKDASDSEDMSYIKFGGSYGLNDFLVFDFTGDNVPLMSFFTTNVTNTVYNQEEDADTKGWIVANGMTTMRGLMYSGSTSNLANRLNIIGPYKISNLYDNTANNKLPQVRASEGNAASPSPITMPALQSLSDKPFRMIVGWVPNGNYMNLCMYVIDLSNGQTYLNYNLNKSIAKADWEGDIVLYGHFARETYVDALYPIEEDTTIDAVVEKYSPDMLVYKGAWDGDKLTLEASTHVGADSNIPLNSGYKEDMSYIAFDGVYGLNDYVVFDFTGNNFPFVSFFNSKITNSIFNFANDASVTGWIIANGINSKGGSAYGGDGGAHANRLLFVGSNKISYRYDENGSTGQWRSSIGSASSPSPIAMTPLKSVTDTYRAIIGYVDNGGNGAKARIYVINMVTGAVVVNYTQVLANPYTEGSIMLYGQFGKTTVLDKVFGVEENTTIDALIAKYAKDSDYSDEAAVTLDRYAYSSLSNGQWTLDGETQVANPTDFRTQDSTYTTYKNAGFNILLAQDMIGTDGNKDSWGASENKQFMDKAHAAGLKVILTDWHLQVISRPITIKSNGPAAADSTYVPWIIGTDASATSGPAKEWLDILSGLNITVDSTRFADRDKLDKWVYDQLAPYMNHPAFYGVMLADEPTYHNAYCYGEIYKSIKRVMADCYVQYNLLPLEHNFSTIQYRYPGVNAIGKNITNAQIETAYKSYVTSFLDTMGTDYIQYDDYPFKSAEEGFLFWTETTPYIDPTSLRNIQLMAEIAKERDLDVKVVTQSCVSRTSGASSAVHIRQITENDARWLNNYLMGFGVKQINYFTYWTKSANASKGEYFDDGGSFVNRDGTTTALYDFMKTIMADNTKFASTIFNFDYNASRVYGSDNSGQNNKHISWSSSLTASTSFRWISNVTSSKEYTLVTELYDSDKYNYMYMLMNTIDPSEGATQSITITFKEGVTRFYVYDQSGNRTSHTGSSYTVSLAAGQAIYVMPY